MDYIDYHSFTQFDIMTDFITQNSYLPRITVMQLARKFLKTGWLDITIESDAFKTKLMTLGEQAGIIIFSP